MFYFLSLLEVLPIALSKSGVSPPSKNGNSLQGMKSPVVFCFLLLGGFGGAGLFLIVSGSCFLGVTPLKILLSNFCCTGVTRSSSSSLRSFPTVQDLLRGKGSWELPFLCTNLSMDRSVNGLLFATILNLRIIQDTEISTHKFSCCI